MISTDFCSLHVVLLILGQNKDLFKDILALLDKRGKEVCPNDPCVCEWEDINITLHMSSWESKHKAWKGLKGKMVTTLCCGLSLPHYVTPVGCGKLFLTMCICSSKAPLMFNSSGKLWRKQPNTWKCMQAFPLQWSTHFLICFICIKLALIFQWATKYQFEK